MAHCKIVITDEVNCKLADLDLDTRKFAIRSDAEVEEAKARAIPGLTL